MRNIRGRKLFVVCLGINDIPENIGTLTINRQNEELSKIRRKIGSVIDSIRSYHPVAQIMFATFPSKEDKKSEKIPREISCSGRKFNQKYPTGFLEFC